MMELDCAITVVRLELRSDIGRSTQADSSAAVRGHLLVSIRSPLCIPRQATFKYRHLTAGHHTVTAASPAATNTSHRHHPHHRSQSTAVASL